MPTTAEDFAYPDTDAQYGAVPLPVVKFDGPTALLPRWTGALPPSDSGDVVYGVAMPPSHADAEQEEEEEVATFEPPNWAKLPAGHPEIRLEVWNLAPWP